MLRNGLIIFAADYLIFIALFLAAFFWRRQPAALSTAEFTNAR